MQRPLQLNGPIRQPTDKMVLQHYAQIEPVQYRWTKICRVVFEKGFRPNEHSLHVS